MPAAGAADEVRSAPQGARRGDDEERGDRAGRRQQPVGGRQRLDIEARGEERHLHEQDRRRQAEADHRPGGGGGEPAEPDRDAGAAEREGRQREGARP
jgi:hypothetical protein